MIRNRYNRIPHPVLNTKRERDPYNYDGTKQKQHKWKAKGTALSQQMATRLSKINWTVSQRQTESGRTLTIRINHNISIALERSVINYLAGGGLLKPVLRSSNLTLGRFCCGSYTHRSCSVRVMHLLINESNSEHINQDSSLRWNKTSTQQQTNSETLEQQRSNSWTRWHDQRQII